MLACHSPNATRDSPAMTLSTPVHRLLPALAISALAAASCTQSASTSSASASSVQLVSASSAKERPATTDVECTKAPLTVVSYNVNYGLAGESGSVDQATAQQIAELAKTADVIAFQETTDRWERAIVELTKASHPHRSFHAPGRFVAGGIGVVSRLPITAEDLLPSPVDWFPAQRLELSTPDGPLQVLNVHLRPMISESGSWVSGYFNTGHFRESEANAHFEKLRKDLPTIVLGDFNEEDPGVALTIFEGMGLRNAVSIEAPTETTWRWTAYSIPLALRLDHVLYPPASFELASAKVYQGGNSDHLPVEVKLVPRCVVGEGMGAPSGGSLSQSSLF